MNKCIRIVIFLLVVLLVVVGVTAVYMYSTYRVEYRDIVAEICNECGVSTSLIFAIMKNESAFNVNALSSKGAIGIMQIMPSTASWIVDNSDLRTKYNSMNIDLFDAKCNIDIGVHYVEYLMKKYDNDTIKVVAAYNAGEGNVDTWIAQKVQNMNATHTEFNMEDIRFEETRNYVAKVLKSRYYYEKLYNLE